MLGLVPGLIGTMQALETVKLLTGLGEVAYDKLLVHDALTHRLNSIRLSRDPDCRLCGRGLPAVTSVCNMETTNAMVCHSVMDATIEIQAAELRMKLMEQGSEDFCVIDVREGSERALHCIDGSEHHPMSEWPDTITKLPRDRPIILYCQSGFRSRQCAAMLAEYGFQKVAHLAGGLDAWLVDGMTGGPAVK